MAFSESSHPTQQANSLVSFLDTASKTITGLMGESSKGNKRKVNHKKYLQKRLQRKPAQPKASKQTKSKSAQQLPPTASASKAREIPASGAPSPIVHHNSWPQLPGYSQPSSVEPDIDFLLQQLSSSASDMPPVSRPCSESSFYPLRSFAGPQPLPTVPLESQVLIAEQPYGSPYTPSNSSVDELLDDSAYSSPCSSIHNSPATASLAQEWQCCPVTTSVPVCLPSTTSNCWGIPPSCIASCVASTSDWLPMTSSAITTACPMDQHLPPTVPQLWDQINFCEQVHY